MRRLLLTSMIFATSCVTVTGRKLPVVNAEEFSTQKKILVTFAPDLKDWRRVTALKALNEAKISFINTADGKELGAFKPENQIKAFNDFDRMKVPLPKHDLEFEIVWENFGFYEPYCAIFLTVIPCTPPYKWLVGIRVKDSSGKLVKDFNVKEDATEIYWLFGLHKPNVPDGDVERDVLRNAFTNILIDIRKDGFL